MNETILGKISDIHFGLREGRIGLWITLSGSWSVQTSYECWSPEDIEPGDNHKWTEEDRKECLAKIMYKISELLHKAKVENINELINIPVEFTSKNQMLDSWRILEEVL
jgi:hypothetical protein